MNLTPDNGPEGRLDPDIDPPAHLKRRVERTLRARRFVAPRMPTWFRIAGSAAAALLLVAAGFWLGAVAGAAGDSAADAASSTAETRYVLLLYEGDDFRPSADEDALVAEYSRWAGGLARRGSLIAGEKLAEAGILLEAPGGDGVPLRGVDHASPLGRLGGYFVISAADRAEALAIAGTCPHLRHGGRIVMRPIVST